MKRIKILGIGLASLVLLNAGASVVSAATLSGQTKDTPTSVIILDDEDPTDPLDPGDKDQKHLTLEAVPVNYNFTSKLVNGSYDLTSSLTNESVDVFNDRTDREWSVKAKVVDDKLTLKDDSTKTFSVTSFKINEDEIVGTGSTGIVSKAVADKTADNNTGLIEKAVSNVSIGFTDGENVLKVNDELNGVINYQLYNTPDAL